MAQRYMRRAVRYVEHTFQTLTLKGFGGAVMEEPLWLPSRSVATRWCGETTLKFTSFLDYVQDRLNGVPRIHYMCGAGGHRTHRGGASNEGFRDARRKLFHSFIFAGKVTVVVQVFGQVQNVDYIEK